MAAKVTKKGAGNPPPVQSAESFLGLWILAGREASRAFDADGLPRWGRHPEHGWHHASASAVALAEEAAAHGFDLPAFDCWLSALPACPIKAELLRRRALALEWALSNDGERSRLLRHLEFMQERWRADLREQALLPLARFGRHVEEQRRDAGFSSGDERRRVRRPVWDQWQRRVDELRASNPRRSKADICSQVGNEHGVTGRAVSKRVK